MAADRVREFLAWIIQDEASMDRMCRMFAQVKESLKFDTVVLAADGYTGYPVPDEGEPEKLLEEAVEQTELWHRPTKMYASAVTEPLDADEHIELQRVYAELARVAREKGFDVTAQQLQRTLGRAIERRVEEDPEAEQDVILRRAMQDCL